MWFGCEVAGSRHRARAASSRSWLAAPSLLVSVLGACAPEPTGTCTGTLAGPSAAIDVHSHVHPTKDVCELPDDDVFVLSWGDGTIATRVVIDDGIHGLDVIKRHECVQSAA